MHADLCCLFIPGWQDFFSYSSRAKRKKPVERKMMICNDDRGGRGAVHAYFIASCLFISAEPGFGRAQLDHASLKGLSKIKLLVERPDGTARSCGVTEELITAAFMDPASSSALRVTNDAVDLFFTYRSMP
jgi:hypothetical protein